MADCCNDNLTFKGFDSYDDTDFITELQLNLKYFLDYAFLGINAWQAVDTGNATCGNVDVRTLSPLSQPVQRTYTQWASARSDWVWETGVFNGQSPTSPVIYVNDVDRTSDFTINYPKGVITSNTVTTDSGTVTADYSYRKVQVYTLNTMDWWYELLSDTFEKQDDGMTIRSQIYATLNKHRVQTPAIVIESSGRTTSRGKELGSGALIVEHPIIFNIITDDVAVRDKLVAILTTQQGKNLLLFDSDQLSFPLDCNGDLATSQVYPDFVSSADWRCTRMVQTGSATFDSPCPGMFFGRVRIVFEIENPSKT